jgi:hypothetical protein
MAKKSTTDIHSVFREEMKAVTAGGKTGWDAADSETVAMKLITSITETQGVKLKAEATARLKAAMAISPRRIVEIIKKELEDSDTVIDATSEDLLLRIFDIPKLRKELVNANFVKAAGKGKKKTSVADILK